MLFIPTPDSVILSLTLQLLLLQKITLFDNPPLPHKTCNNDKRNID